MDIQHLKEFSYLSKSLNFNETARHFYVSTSVISRHIAALERELGVKLFDRKGSVVRLTGKGQTFAKDAAILLRDYENALVRLEVAHEQTRAVVRIGYLQNASRPFITDFLRTLRSKHPEIEVELSCLSYKELHDALNKHRVDMIFTLDTDLRSEYLSTLEVIYTDELFAIINLDNPLAKKAEGVRIEELVNEHLTLPDPDQFPGFAAQIRQALERYEVAPPHRYIDLETLYLEVEVNNLVGFSTGANRSTYEGRVAFVPITDVDTSVNVCALWRETINGATLTACLSALRASKRSVAQIATPNAAPATR